jgi:hypothetical protein
MSNLLADCCPLRRNANIHSIPFPLFSGATGSIVKWIKHFGVYFITAGEFYLILVYIADLSIRQSIVLALMIASLARGLKSAAAKPAMRFSPYYIRVYPNWYDLLIDFKLIDKPEEWHAIQKSFEALPPTDYRVLRSGVCFTVAHQSEDFERTLIYSDNHRAFVSEVDFQEDAEPLRIDRLNRFGKANRCDVRFFMKLGGREGYNLGIRVPSRWWERVKDSCPKPKKEDADYTTGQIDLILATISYREFDLYWEPVEWSNTFYDKTSKQIRARRDEHRQNLNWKTIEHDADLGRELGIDWPESIEQKYFTVEHRGI